MSIVSSMSLREHVIFNGQADCCYSSYKINTFLKVAQESLIYSLPSICCCFPYFSFYSFLFHSFSLSLLLFCIDFYIIELVSGNYLLLKFHCFLILPYPFICSIFLTCGLSLSWLAILQLWAGTTDNNTVHLVFSITVK